MLKIFKIVISLLIILDLTAAVVVFGYILFFHLLTPTPHEYKTQPPLVLQETVDATTPASFIQVEEPIVQEVVEEMVEPNYISLGSWTTTAYCACEICCGEWATGCTASGVLATEGRTVACGSLPFGTEVMIDGHNYIVEDTGVEGEWIDIFFNNHQEASDYGIHEKEIFLIA